MILLTVLLVHGHMAIACMSMLSLLILGQPIKPPPVMMSKGICSIIRRSSWTCVKLIELCICCPAACKMRARKWFCCAYTASDQQ